MLVFMPLFFSTNIIFGRAAVTEVGPYTLATLRWGFAALILLPFVWATFRLNWSKIISLLPRLIILGLLGMWICGAIVYVALTSTTATNGTLIYTASPVLVILFERLFRGRKTGFREVLGIAIACLGIGIIVFKASLSNVAALEFNVGDLLFVGTALSWAIYSVLLKSDEVSELQTFPLFCLVAGTGAILLLPFSFYEIATSNALPSSLYAWSLVAGIVVFSSLIAFSSFQIGVRIVGASTTSIFLYLLPVYGVALAVLFLGETFHFYHLAGIAAVLGGVILATFPKDALRRKTSDS